MIEALAPGARGSRLVPLFDGKASQWRIANWRAGRRGYPRWAIEILRTKLQRRHALELEAISKMKEGPGLKAGARNLAEYLARRR